MTPAGFEPSCCRPMQYMFFYQVSIPVGSDTLRVRRRRREVEERLSQLDEAMRTYSRPVVYVLHQENSKEGEGRDS